MAARHFDRGRVRAVRRAADIPQSAVAASVGVADSTVAGWETGLTAPDPEKLPALARALGRPLDELFPRTGLPDLTDLRCDAGLFQYETPAIIGTKSAGPVAGAERGERRLKEKYVQALAARYGVTVEELRKAEDRSIAKANGQDLEESAEEGGDASPLLGSVPAELPETLAEKITYLVERLPTPLSDAEVAAEGNSRTGTRVLTEESVRRLRTGEVTAASEAVLGALAEALDTTPLIWSDDANVQRIIAGTWLLKSEFAAIAARGGEKEGLSADLLSFIRKEVEQARAEAKAQPDHP
ncbi:helix-turn-helix transcriptional regulator [Streptomyces niveiscabiei]|uniref:helix-turn-helix transcriptional regulator n=1 Tax=Streptomyces niveiscabiei TaxID=164115 RepID=UPI0006EBCFBB|nr:helix-turn-helix transcriptional regulator [Streptomyces niveiscabiei]